MIEKPDGSWGVFFYLEQLGGMICGEVMGGEGEHRVRNEKAIMYGMYLIFFVSQAPCTC